MPQLETYKGEYLWPYVPNLPAAVLFAVIFTILTAAHTHKMMTTKLWICTPFVIGSICEPLAYLFRAISTYHTSSLPLFLMQAIFLLLPPTFFAATLYMVYARIVLSVHGSPFSPVSPRWCTRIFVLADLTCLNIQSSGAGLLGNPRIAQIGKGIVVAGLAVQVVVFIGFVGCCWRFHFLYSKQLRSTGRVGRVDGKEAWESALYMLYATSAIISVRNVFRFVEYVMGKGSYLFENEWTVYIFDGVLMVAVMVLFYVWYPDLLQDGGRPESMIELTGEADGSEEQGYAAETMTPTT